MAVGYVESFMTGPWMWRDYVRRGNAMFPFFLHRGMHDQEGVVGKVNGDLTLFVGSGIGVVVLRHYSTHAELTSDTDRETCRSKT
jgi:hypothetical protein